MTISFTYNGIDDVSYELTRDQIQTVKDTLGLSYLDLADVLTGYNCDSYADATEELITEADGNIQAAIEYDEETYNRVRAYHRIMNGALSDEDCEDAWLDSLSGYDA